MHALVIKKQSLELNHLHPKDDISHTVSFLFQEQTTRWSTCNSKIKKKKKKKKNSPGGTSILPKDLLYL